MQSKKGFNSQITGVFIGLATLVVIIVVIGLVLSVGSDITTDTQADYLTMAAGCNATSTTRCGFAYNASGNALDSVENVSDKQPQLSNVVMGAAIITVLLAAFGGFLYMNR